MANTLAQEIRFEAKDIASAEGYIRDFAEIVEEVLDRRGMTDIAKRDDIHAFINLQAMRAAGVA